MGSGETEVGETEMDCLAFGDSYSCKTSSFGSDFVFLSLSI